MPGKENMEQFYKEALKSFEKNCEEGEGVIHCYYYTLQKANHTTYVMTGITNFGNIVWSFRGESSDLEEILGQLTTEYLNSKSSHLAEAKTKGTASAKNH